VNWFAVFLTFVFLFLCIALYCTIKIWNLAVRCCCAACACCCYVADDSDEESDSDESSSEDEAAKRKEEQKRKKAEMQKKKGKGGVGAEKGIERSPFSAA